MAINWAWTVAAIEQGGKQYSVVDAHADHCWMHAHMDRGSTVSATVADVADLVRLHVIRVAVYNLLYQVAGTPTGMLGRCIGDSMRQCPPPPPEYQY